MQDDFSFDTRWLKFYLINKLSDWRRARSPGSFRWGKILLTVLQNFI